MHYIGMVGRRVFIVNNHRLVTQQILVIPCVVKECDLSTTLTELVTMKSNSVMHLAMVIPERTVVRS